MGERIKAFRLERGLSQEDLAAKAGVDVKTIQRIESGDANPLQSTVFDIATALKVHISELF